MNKLKAQLISAYEFAKKKKVSPKAVYNKIKKGEIKTVPAG